MAMTNVQQRPGWLTCIIVAITVCAAAGAPAEDIGPRAGSLVLIGGGRPLPDDALKRFVELAGGPDAPIVIIPTAGGAPAYDDSFIGVADLRRAGARNLRILHTYDRTEADSATFIAPLRTARGVFIYGGTNAILVDAYVNTNTLREIRSLLDRGGVVGGTSAGAEVQGSFMPRGQTGDSDGKVLIGDHQVGFGFLNHVAVDAHWAASGVAWNRP
jgi:cyanophycinase-like exopeptidase